MASARARGSGYLTCLQVLNIMVILGFMFNYMLRVNLTIAIVAMTNVDEEVIVANDTQETNVTETNTSPTPFAKQYEKFNWNKFQQNEALGSFFWGYILTELPGGRLAEVIGARRVFGGGMLVASVLTLLTPAACHLHHVALVVLRGVLGFFLGATWPAIPPMAAKWVPPMERSKFIANMMASSLGAALTMPLCGCLIDWFGWGSVFYITGAIGLVWSVAWFFLVFDSPAQHPRISHEERYEIETLIAEDSAGKGVKPSRVPWKAILTSLPVWAIIITHACSVFGYFTVVNQLPTYMKEVLNFDIKKNGLISSLPYLGKYVMAIMASYMADRLRKSGRLSTTATRKSFTTFAVLTPGVLMVFQALFGIDASVSVTIFTLSLFFNGAVTAGYLSNGLDIAPNFSGTIFGLANTLSSFGGWLSTKIVAALTNENHTFAQWRHVFWILMAAYAVGAFVYLLLGSGELQPWNSVAPRTSSVDGKAPKSQEMQPLRNKEKEIMA